MKKKKKNGLWFGLVLLLAVVGILPFREQQTTIPAGQEHVTSYAVESQTDSILSEAADVSNTLQSGSETQDTTSDTAQSSAAKTQQDTAAPTEGQPAENAELQTLSATAIPA